MHRQSLGSPSPKLVNKDEQVIMNTSSSDHEIHKQFASQSSANLFYEKKEEEEEEELKKLRGKANYTVTQTCIHLIPMLTLLCFLILYLSSHHPSQNDLAEFNVSNTFSNPAPDMLEEIKEIKRGDMVTIRSLMNLEGRTKHRLLHRKIPHF